MRQMLFSLFFLMSLAGCEQTMKDVSSEPKYGQHVGARYEIVGPVDAYGIRKHSDAPVRYVTLIPPPGIAGSEVGFVFPIKPGAQITITNVFETNRLPAKERFTFLVRLEGTPFPDQMPVMIDLLGDNQGPDRLLLNPKFYRRIEQ